MKCAETVKFLSKFISYFTTYQFFFIYPDFETGSDTVDKRSPTNLRGLRKRFRCRMDAGSRSENHYIQFNSNWLPMVHCQIVRKARTHYRDNKHLGNQIQYLPCITSTQFLRAVCGASAPENNKRKSSKVPTQRTVPIFTYLLLRFR